MSVSNKGIFLFFRIFLAFLIAVIIADLLLARIPGSIGEYFEPHYFTFASLAIILILLFIRINYFSYEDEYEIIHIRSKSLLFGSLSGNGSARYEFPKGILNDYSFERGFMKKKLTLVLKTSSSKEKKTRHFNLLFVNDKKVQYVLSSLKKIKQRNMRTGRQETV